MPVFRAIRIRNEGSFFGAQCIAVVSDEEMAHATRPRHLKFPLGIAITTQDSVFNSTEFYIPYDRTETQGTPLEYLTEHRIGFVEICGEPKGTQASKQKNKKTTNIWPRCICIAILSDNGIIIINLPDIRAREAGTNKPNEGTETPIPIIQHTVAHLLKGVIGAPPP
jgi:hypothetical protein